MAEHKHHGPLHLSRYLTVATDAIAKAISSAVSHPLSVVKDLACHCTQTVVLQARKKIDVHQVPPHVASEVEKRTSEVRRRNIESARSQPQSSAACSSQPSDAAQGSTHKDTRAACRFFSLQVNDEEGIVHAYCRRCNRMVLVYDRALYWGVKRPSGAKPQTYPYKCSCGGHTFEVGLGFEYPEDALDENDLTTITVAVRCASCNEVAIVFDDEAT